MALGGDRSVRHQILWTVGGLSCARRPTAFQRQMEEKSGGGPVELRLNHSRGSLLGVPYGGVGVYYVAIPHSPPEL